MLIGIEASHANKKQRTGVEQVCFHLIQELKNIIPSSERVVLYSNTPLAGDLAKLPENWSVKVLKWPFFKGWSQIRLSWEFLFNKPDVFLAPGQLVPLISPKKTISIVHDSAFRALPNLYWWASRWYLHLMNKLICKKSSLIITPSQFSKDELLKYYNFPAEKIKVVAWGYEKNIFNSKVAQFSQDELKQKYKITKPYIISVGRLETKKNTQNIIKSFNILRKGGQDLQLFLVGAGGVGWDVIKQEIDNSEYKKDIILAGWVDNDLPKLYAGALGCVFPSLYEGFGLPVLEAMSCGCPIILSKIESLQEVGGNDKNSPDYVDPTNPQEIAQAVEKLVTNPELRQNKVAYGINRAGEFSWIKTGKEVWNLIKNLVL